MNTKVWKILGVVLVAYSVIGGFLMEAPDDMEGILGKTVRNLHFHVPMWFSMITLLLVAYMHSIRYLNSGAMRWDRKAESFTHVAIVFGILGLLTGSFWAKHTWGVWWVADAKLNGAAIGMMVYMAYIILRNSADDERKRAKLSAVYTLFAFPIFIALIIVLPKMAEVSQHPGSGDTVAFSNYEGLDNNLRKVFYPAVIGWILLGYWISTLRFRIIQLTQSHENTL